MPTYRFKCSECGVEFEEYISLENYSAQSICRCGGIAPRVFTTPALMGLNKGPNMKAATGRYQKHIDRVDTIGEVEAEYRAWEATGTMTKAQKESCKVRLADLKASQARGEIKVVDYQVEGHPLEKPIPKDGEEI